MPYQSEHYILKLLLISAIATLTGAYFFEFVIELNPCKLCLYQRVPWWLVVGVTMLGLIYKDRPHLVTIFIILASIILLAGAMLAAFHVGVEQHWWTGPVSCVSSSSMPDNLVDLKASILSAPVIRCDEIPWSLFGVSMAGYNFLISLVIGIWGMYVGIGFRN